MRILICILVFVLTGCATDSPRNGLADADLAFDHVNVVDVVGGRVLPDRTVFVDDGRIVEVRSSTDAAPRATKVVDGKGQYLIPGLWDMHVHLFRHAVRAQTDRGWFPLFIANGVTGVREMFANFEDQPIMARWRRELDEGRIGPRIVASGLLVDGDPPIWKGSVTANDPETARAVVRQAATGGADFIKPYGLLSPEVFATLGEEARRLGIGFAGHIPESMRAVDAAKGGIQSFEHMMLLDRDCSGSDRSLEEWHTMLRKNPAAFNQTVIDEFDAGRCRQIAQEIARTGAWAEIDFVFRLALADQRWRSRDLLRYIKPEYRAGWPGERAPDVEKRLMAKEKVKVEIAKALIAAEVPVFAGTDVGNAYLVPGYSLHDVLELMVSDLGVTPAQALRSATIAPARFMKLDNVHGTVAKGRHADLVLLSKNPLTDIRNTRSIAAVALRGKLLDRPQLDALLAEAERVAQE